MACIKLVLCPSAALASALCASAALAQSTKPAQTGEDYSSGIQDIVVTAQRRSEVAQKVPISIVALDTQRLEAAVATNLTDVGKLAGNVQLGAVGTTPGYANFYIRGVGLNTSTRGIDPAVGVFVDGVYRGTSAGAIADLVDVARVEILRGPQGTLFGKNVTGGAIVVTSSEPTDYLEGDLKISVGNFNYGQATGIFNAPLSESVGFRMAATYKHNGGFYRNLTLGGRVDERDLFLVRPSLKFNLNDSVSLLLIGEYERDRSGPGVARNIVNVERPKIAQTVFGYLPPENPYNLTLNPKGFTNNTSFSLTGQFEWESDPGTLTLIGNYRKFRFAQQADFDGTPYTIFEFPITRDRQQQHSIEARFASDSDGRLSYVVGAFYFEQDYFVAVHQRTLSVPPSQANPSGTFLNLAGLVNGHDRTFAGFAQFDYKVTDALKITAGARATHDRKELIASIPGTCQIDFSSCSSEVSIGKTWKNISPKVGFNYQFGPDAMVYGSWTKGFRSGAFNSRSSTVVALGPTDPESVSTFEAGFKATLFNRRLRLNGAAFLSDYKDLQRTAIKVLPDGRPQNVIDNVGKAKIKGFEFDAQALLAEGLTLSVAIGYTDAKYVRFTDQTVVNAGLDPLKLKLERVPKWTGNLGLQYEVPVGDGNISFNTSVTYKSKQYFELLNREYLSQGKYAIWDASVTWRLNESIEFAAFGKNLTNKYFLTWGADLSSLTTLNFGGEPRQYGISARFKFK